MRFLIRSRVSRCPGASVGVRTAGSCGGASPQPPPPVRRWPPALLSKLLSNRNIRDPRRPEIFTSEDKAGPDRSVNGRRPDTSVGGVTDDTVNLMPMTLRLSDDEAEALRRRAEFESRSMQDVARQAVREYVETHSRADLLDQVLDTELPRYAEALERLGQ